MADVFLSYAREDLSFVRQLTAGLRARNREVWVDLEDIIPSARWREEIRTGITQADAFVFIITPDSVASEVCRTELDYATEASKRLIPILARETPHDGVPPPLAEVNWLVFLNGTDFEVDVDRLVDVLDTDIDRVHLHTRLLVRADQWETRDRDRSLLLRGGELKEAETWLANQTGHKPASTPAQAQLILASRRAATRRQRGFGSTAVIVAVVMAVLAVFARIQRNTAVEQANIALARQLAATSASQLPTNLDIAQLLAVKAYRTNPNPQTRSALLEAVTSSPHLVRYLPMGDQVTALAGSEDGHSLAAGRADGRVLRWNLAEPAPQIVIAFPAAVASLAVNRDGTILVATDRSDAMLWQQTRPLAKIALPLGEKADVVALSPSGRTAVVHSTASNAERHKSIVIVDVPSGTTRSIRDDPHQGLASSSSLVAPSDDELFLLDRAYGGWQRRRISDWELEASSSAEFGVHNYAVGTSSGGGFFTETNGSDTIPVWPTTGTTDYYHPDFTAQAPISSPNSLTLSPDGAKAAVSDSGIIYVSPVAPEGAPRDAPVQLLGNGSINNDGVRFFGDGSHLLSASGDKIALWDLGQLNRATHTVRIPIPSSCNACAGPSVAIAPDGRHALVIDGNGYTAVVQALVGGGEHQVIRGSSAPVGWDSAGRPVVLPEREQSDLIAAAMARDGHTVVIVNRHGQIRLYDTKTGTVRARLPGPTDLAGDTNTLSANSGSVAIKPTSDLVAIVNNGSVMITDLDQRKVVGTISGPDVSSVTFSGKRLLVQRTASPWEPSTRPSGVLEVWDERGSTRERALSGDKSYVWPPVANQQGTVVARRRSNGSIVLADLDSGTALVTMPPTGGPRVFKTGIAFSPDGTQLITVSETDVGNEALLVQRQISDDALVRIACVTAGRDLTPAEWQTFVGTNGPSDSACR